MYSVQLFELLSCVDCHLFFNM